jgi:hypothetical protein
MIYITKPFMPKTMDVGNKKGEFRPVKIHPKREFSDL